MLNLSLYFVKRTPRMINLSFVYSLTVSIVSFNLTNPFSEKYAASTGIIISSETVNAFTVNIPKLGGQSIII